MTNERHDLQWMKAMAEAPGPLKEFLKDMESRLAMTANQFYTCNTEKDMFKLQGRAQAFSELRSMMNNVVQQLKQQNGGQNV